MAQLPENVCCPAPFLQLYLWEEQPSLVCSSRSHLALQPIWVPCAFLPSPVIKRRSMQSDAWAKKVKVTLCQFEREREPCVSVKENSFFLGSVWLSHWESRQITGVIELFGPSVSHLQSMITSD
ncbi:UNVERIFIED_CONTAM: hypothetical protein K2H54_057051 [Gekko kuhli]